MANSNPRKRSRRKKPKLPSWVLILLGGVGLFALGWLVGQWKKEDPTSLEGKTAAKQETRVSSRESAESTPAKREVPESNPEAATPRAKDAETEATQSLKKGRIAIVIDDFGRSVQEVDAMNDLGIPVTFAVLPFEVRTGAVVDHLKKLDVEVILHLPMEPGNGKNPGLGALRASMTEDEIRKATRKAFRAVPIAAGVNNHMGSRLTAERAVMDVVMDEVAAQGVFFIDSRTSAESVAYQVALEKQIPSAERRVFLDTDPSEESILEQCHRLAQLAEKHGSAIAIGHPYDSTHSVLKTWLAAEGRDFEFVPVSHLLDRPGSGPLE